ncbi:MAG: hypothetical protein NTY14_00660 [Candidatus Omnitrophica bacterium]|nr:hypothetical protein [Candidatus Omnitrophota bacterium]
MRFSRVKKLLQFCCALALVFQLAGCESLGRKFVRKPNPESLKKEEVVFAPQEYKDEGVTNADLYRQYFLYWKTWQDELIDSLESSGNRKRQIDSLNEGLKNLDNIKPLVKPEAAARLEAYIKDLQELREAIIKDDYANRVADNRRQAERIKRAILDDFSFGKIKDSIL